MYRRMVFSKRNHHSTGAPLLHHQESSLSIPLTFCRSFLLFYIPYRSYQFVKITLAAVCTLHLNVPCRSNNCRSFSRETVCTLQEVLHKWLIILTLRRNSSPFIYIYGTSSFSNEDKRCCRVSRWAVIANILSDKRSNSFISPAWLNTSLIAFKSFFRSFTLLRPVFKRLL